MFGSVHSGVGVGSAHSGAGVRSAHSGVAVESAHSVVGVGLAHSGVDDGGEMPSLALVPFQKGRKSPTSLSVLLHLLLVPCSRH